MSVLESLTLKDSPLPRIKVQASVVFSILNSFSRRSSKDSRVIGTLLGENKDGIIHITECFAIPINERLEDNYVLLGENYHKTMVSYHRKINKKEQVVGWYATTTRQGEFIVNTSSIIHETYKTDLDHPIHLVVDTTLVQHKLPVRAFVSRPTFLGNELLANTFHEIRVDIEFTDASASIVNLLAQEQQKQEAEENFDATLITELPSSVAVTKKAIDQLLAVLDQLQGYVDQVVDGSVVGDRDLGISLTEILNIQTNQHLSSQQIQALSSRYQDLLTVSFLSSLTQNQSLIAEKLNQVL